MAKQIDLKQSVHDFWQEHPCGSKFSDAETGTRQFFDRVEAHRYEKEWHIAAAADFPGTRGLRVLEIGCGIGTDGLQFARAGAVYTGVDLTEAAVDLARKNFASAGLLGEFRVADAESLDFADESFDIVYSRSEARELFERFSRIKMRAYFLNKRFIPLIGNLLPRSIESALASRWGWHLWIYATK